MVRGEGGEIRRDASARRGVEARDRQQDAARRWGEIVQRGATWRSDFVSHLEGICKQIRKLNSFQLFDLAFHGRDNSSYE
jgi:hypothetical protein